MIQATWCAEQLTALGLDVELVPIHTSGDVDRSSAIANLGAQGVFTKEIQRALLNGEIDAAVHSLKDLPVEHIPGLHLAATPAREDPRDVFLSNRYRALEELPPGAILGTGSMRRKSMALRACATLRPDDEPWDVRNVRGNVETRLKKLDDGEFDALILANAGLARLGFDDRPRVFLEPPLFLPAVGQGALGIETRDDAHEINDAVLALNDEPTYLSVAAERAFLERVQGGCLMPVGALARLVALDEQNDALSLNAQILSFDGRQAFQTQSLQFIPKLVNDSPLPWSTKVALAKLLGSNAADNLVEQGAGELVEQIKETRLQNVKRDPKE